VLATGPSEEPLSLPLFQVGSVELPPQPLNSAADTAMNNGPRPAPRFMA
jgi:hypothetical protein